MTLRTRSLCKRKPYCALAAAKRFGAVAGTRTDGGKTVSTLGFTAPGQLRATGLIDERKLVTRVESTMPHPVFGDTAVLSEFLDYNSGQFPQRIRQSQDGGRRCWT